MCRYLFLVLVLLTPQFLFAQIDLDAYKKYKNEHKDISYKDILKEFDVGTFARYCPTNYSKAAYFDSTNKFMNFTSDELKLIAENGFVVTERMEVDNFIKGYYNVFVHDLPVYISADLFNHALFFSTTDLMQIVEEEVISTDVSSLLNTMREEIPNLQDKSQEISYQNALRDLDAIFCVALNLFADDSTRNVPHIQEDYEVTRGISHLIIESIHAEHTRPEDFVKDIVLPSGLMFHKVDLSQYKPRGHYQSEELKKYFKAMMWIGRLFFNIPDKEEQVEQLKSSIIMSGLIGDLTKKEEIRVKYDKIDAFLEFYISEQNNLTVEDVQIAYSKLNVSNIAEIIEKDLLWQYCIEMKSTGRGVQLYNTQVASSGTTSQYFSLLGQRPTVDAFVFGNVVYSATSEPRMLPDALDILFALGNDAAIHLLEEEIEGYKYQSNLASCRYVIDHKSPESWETSMYNLWIQALRSLNPPKQREALPKFMQAAAWQHKNMNTQLASWAELRHLTVLYVKQSYSGQPICDFPYFFIEPRPEYFDIMLKLNKRIVELLNRALEDNPVLVGIEKYKNEFENKDYIYKNLREISAKQYNGQAFSEDDIKFLKKMIFEYYRMSGDCADPDGYRALGWIYTLFNMNYESIGDLCRGVDGIAKPKKSTTDVHTSPYDSGGKLVGWVKHAAAGDQQYCTIITDNLQGESTTYTGVVNSYYEYVTENFQRDTDEEWLAKMDQIPSPSFTNIYLADKNGYREDIAELVRTHDVSVEDKTGKEKYSIEIYPNVFKDEFTISIQSKEDFEGVAQIAMYSSSGELVFKAQYNNLPNGQIMINPADNGLSNLNAGVYIIELKLGENVYSGKAIKIK